MAIAKKQTNQKMSPRAANAVTAKKSQTSVNKSQSQNSKVEKEPMPMGKINYILMGVSLLLIVIGFVLMSGSSNEGDTFNYDVFNSTRIVVAPFITFLGFLCMIPAILYKGKRDDVSSLDVNDNSDPESNIIVKEK
ncbi:MAG: DUF3098 domain-containing protein [Muribaculaceae bacterium]|nr:DUF3098 domain-containing protein [Muribaculaceae bacterium]